jgi:hypothetical protein
MRKNQYTIFLDKINSFKVYPEVVFSEIFRYYGNFLIMNEIPYVFHEGFVFHKGFTITPFRISYDDNILMDICKKYKKDTGNEILFNYFKLLREFFDLSSKYETEASVFLKCPTPRYVPLETNLNVVMRQIDTFHENPELSKLILAHKL